MSTRYVSLSLTKEKFAIVLCLFVFGLFSASGYAQIRSFSADSIPLVDDEVVFTVHFEADLTKEQFREKAYHFLDSELDPYSGSFLKNSPDSTVCQIVDYLEIESTVLHVFGMYMTYDMKLTYQEGSCDLTFYHIKYMEKSYFEAQEEASRKLNMPEFSGKEIMIDKKYSQLLIKKASNRITEASINRFNEIAKNLKLYFVE